MIIIGELINGMYRGVARAIEGREADVIQHLAIEQSNAGAAVLDVHAGPYSKDPVSDMQWLVGSIQEVYRGRLSIDAKRLDVIEAGLKGAPARAMINSTSADEGRMNEIFALAKRYNAQVIALAMGTDGVPADKFRRVENAAKIVTKAVEYGIAMEDLFIDPILLPVNVAQAQAVEVLEAIREFKILNNPAPRSVIGLSNFSQGTKARSFLNRTFLTMALSSGLDAAILDPLDKELMQSLAVSELVLNRTIYCDSFLGSRVKEVS